MLIPSDLMAVDDLANQIASSMFAGVKDSVPVNGYLCDCRLSCLFTYRRPDILVVECINGLINWQSSWSVGRYVGLGEVFVAGFCMTCPVHFIEVDVGLTRPFNRGQF